MTDTPICVVYRHTPQGDVALSFAAGLIDQVGGGKLFVYLNRGNAAETALIERVNADCPSLSCDRHVAADVAGKTGLSASRIELVTLAPDRSETMFPAGAIVVDHNEMGRTVNTLLPFDEVGLGCRGRGPLVIPFGNDESSLQAAVVGIPLAKRLGRDIVFFHTTWRNPAIASGNPADHMCSNAMIVGDRLQEHARANGVSFSVVVETARDVVEGLIQCAMRAQANLIVMSRGLKTGLGSYVKRTAEQSPVPLLIVGRADGRKDGRP